MRKLKDSGVEWIGEIPTDWSIGRIKYNFYLKGRIGWQGLKADEFVDNGPFLVTGTDFENGNVNWSKCYHISEERYMEAPEIHVENGDLLVTKDGTVGKVAYINNKPEKVSLNSHLLLIRPNSQLYYNKFLFWVIQSPIFDKYFSLSQNGTIMASLSQEKINNFSFPLPGMETQQCIADYLDRKCSQIDAIIARQREVIEKLKAYKLSVITEAVTKGLNPDVPMKDSGVEWIGEIPEHWSESTILRNIRFEGGSQPPLEHFIDEPRKGYIRLIQNRDYRTDDYATYVPITMVSKFCTKEDVMIGRYGPPIFVIHRGLEGAYNVALMKAVPINIDREFMFFYLQNSTLLNYIESFSVRTAGQSGVNPNILKRYPMFIPPIEEQKQIAKGLLQNCHHIDNLVANKKSIVEKLMSYKKSLIYEVVTGKREV